VILGYPLRFWWLGASAALMIIGSFGPWVRALFISASGLDGDGWFTLIAGAVAVVLTMLYARTMRRPRPWWPLLVCVVAAGVGVAVTLNIWIDVESADGSGGSTTDEEDLFDFDTDALVSVGWGLVMTLVASISLALAAAFNFFRRAAAETAPAAPTDAPAA
jgi:hypothetical protein